MSSQFGQAKPQQQTNPYANIPGYRTNEPANSAWNRTILAYKAAGVPYTIERQASETPAKQTQESSLGSVSSQPQRSTISTSPEYEKALMESFTEHPEGLRYTGSDKGSYLNALYAKGILTDLDFDKLNSIVKEYNAKITKENVSAKQSNIAARHQQLMDVTATLEEAKKEGASNIEVFRTVPVGPPSPLGKINLQNIAQARLQFLQLTRKETSPVQLFYNQTSKEVKVETLPGVESKTTTYQPADVKTALIGGAVGGFAQVGLMGLAGISRLTGQKITLPGSGITITPTGGIFAQSSNLVEQRVGSDVVSNFLSGKELAKNPTLAVASAIGFGASIVATGGTGFLGKAITGVKEGITLSKFISKNIPTVTEHISAKEAATKTANVINVFEQHVQQIQTKIESLGKTTIAERILETGITRESLVTQAKTLSQYKEQLLTNISQLKTLKGTFETLAAKSPTAIVATTKSNPIQSIEKLGQGLYALYYPAGSKYAGGLVTLGKKGTGTLVQISNKIPEGTKTIRSAELMSGVRGVIRQATIKYANLSGPEKSQKISKDVFTFLKGQKSSYEVTYPKLGKESESLGNISIGTVSEKEMALGKAFVPEASVIGIGEELTFGNIGKITSENRFALSKEILGLREPSYTKAASTGEIHFMEANLKNIVGDINVLKAPAIVKEFKMGLGELAGERAKGFNYLASRFGGKTQESFNLFKKYSPFKSPIEGKGGAGATGKSMSLGRFTEMSRDKYVLEQMMKDTSGKQISKAERNALVRDLGRRTARERTTGTTRLQSFENIMGKTTASTVGRFRKSNDDRFNNILSSQFKTENTTKRTTISNITSITKTKQLSRSDQILIPIHRTIQEPDELTRLDEIFKTRQEEKITPRTIPITRTDTKQTSKPIITSITIPKQTIKQSQKQIILPRYTFKDPLNLRTPPPGKKRIPDGGFPFGFGSEAGGGGAVGGGGSKKSFIGNVPEFQFTGMFNRIETRYGKGGGVPREYKITKTPASNSFTAFSKASGSAKKSGSKQPKSLSNKFTRLI